MRLTGPGNNEKISKVITLSSNYKRHREVVAAIKPAIDCSDSKHMKKALKLSAEKDTYTKNVRQLKLKELKRENDEILKRIVGVKSAVRKEIQPLATQRDVKTLQRSTSRQSVTSAASDTSCASNFRRRTLRQQEIQRENKKIAARIMKPKRGKETDYLGLCNFYDKEQSYSRIRSRFSQRSQTIMQSLALDGLKLKKQHVQFLPQLSFKQVKTQPQWLLQNPQERRRFNDLFLPRVSMPCIDGLMMIRVCMLQFGLQSEVVMLASEIFRSKFSGYSISDHHETFLQMCDRLQELEEMRIVERLARPIPLSNKQELMGEVNASLTVVGEGMAEVQRLSSNFRGKETLQISEQNVTASSWKNGVRRVQAKLTHFYEEKMKYFQAVNKHMQLGLRLVQLEEKDWAKNCLSRMGPFCICG